MSTRQQFLLSKFLNSLNEEWDIPGIEHALGRAREMAPAADLACAAIRAAVTVGNRTPAVIPLPGPHWRAVSSSTVPRMRDVGPGERCTTCAHPEEVCRALYDDFDHKFVSVAEQARRAVAEEAAEAITKRIRADMQARQTRRPEPAPADEEETDEP